jgi:hypothetical protein
MCNGSERLAENEYQQPPDNARESLRRCQAVELGKRCTLRCGLSGLARDEVRLARIAELPGQQGTRFYSRASGYAVLSLIA